MKRRGLIAAAIAAGALVLCGAPVWAETPEPATGEQAAEEKKLVPLGDSTRAWLELQRSGMEESPHSTGLTPPEEHRTRIRHLDSYTHPIPLLFEFESLGSEGN